MGNTGSTTRDTQKPDSTRSVTGLLELIDWAALPAETRQTIRTIGPLMEEGCSQSEMARRLGVPDARVAAMRREMRDAIVSQAAGQLDRLEPPLRALVVQLRDARSSTA
jgi:hypothetical protein